MQRRSALLDAFSALRYPDFQRFSLALLSFRLVTHIHQVTIAWQLLELTGSPLQVGLAGLARAIPHLALSLAGGVIADRADRVRLIGVTQAAIGLLTLLLAALTAAGQIAIWHLYAIPFAISAVQALGTPARTAVVPSLVPSERLVNAIALNATMTQSSQVLGPALGGIGIAAFGLTWTYLASGLATVLSLVALVTIRVRATPPRLRASPWRSMVEGLAFVRRRSVIIAFMAMDTAETWLGSYRALLPFIAVVHGMGANGFGFLSAAPGVGSVVGAVAIMALGDMRYKGLFAVFGVLLYCVALIVLALAPSFLVAVAAAGLLGLFNVVQVVPRNAAILAISPDDLRGRVEAFRTMLAGGAPSLGQATSGAVATVIGAPFALLFGAGACALTVVAIALRSKELRDPELGTVREQASNDVAPPAPIAETAD